MCAKIPDILSGIFNKIKKLMTVQNCHFYSVENGQADKFELPKAGFEA